MKPRPIVGQTLYRLNIGNAARNCEQVLVPVEVKKVGRKYFTCGTEDWDADKYHLDIWVQKTEYSPDYCLYETEREYLDEVESRNISESIRGAIGKYGNSHRLTLHQLRRIMAIIDEG